MGQGSLKPGDVVLRRERGIDRRWRTARLEYVGQEGDDLLVRRPGSRLIERVAPAHLETRGVAVQRSLF